MKLITLPSIIIASILVITGLIFLSEKNSETNFHQRQLTLGKEYPNEWMYNQRAYPTNFINGEAMERAINQSKSILENRSTNGSDWTFAGPLNTGGRITDIAISPENDDHFFVSTPVGGIFKTTNRGVSWTAVFDDVAKPSIGNMAIAPSNVQRIYAGTGEANGSATSGAFFGDGMYRSDDAGENWQHIGLDESNHIGRIVVDPTDPDRVFVAATGKLYDYNEERGIYKTENGGADWEQVLFVTDSTSAIDVAINTNNPNILFAAMWERTRKPWQRDYGGITSAIHRTLDGGLTWEELGTSNGLPASDDQTGRIGVAISESDPSTVYARYTTNEITNFFDGLYKSIDNGDNFTLVSDSSLDGVDSSFGWYFGNVRIHPTNPDEVYILGQRLFKTQNSGGNWSEIDGMHVDHHSMEYSRINPNTIVAGNDGGVYISENGGASWDKFTNLPITQFYNIEVDFMQPERLYGGTQDNNTIRTLTEGFDDWSSIWGGDGFHVNVDPNDNSFVYAESQFGGLGRSTDGGNSFQGATDGIDFNDRNNWNTPVVLSPFNSEKVFYGTNRLYISDRAVLWNPISADLTNGQHPSGSLSYGTLTAIAPSYNNLDVIYTGSDDGMVSVTFDGGITWSTISDTLPNRYVTSIAISPEDDQIAYATFSGFGLLDYDPHIFKTIDGGQTWTDISSNLPSIPVNDVILVPGGDLILVATDINVWYSQDDGLNWDILGNDLPFTIIRDLKYHSPTNTLYAGTFGRSIHKFDLSDIIVLGSDDFLIASEEALLYPNPAKDQVFVRPGITSEGSIDLYNISGKKLKTMYKGAIEATRSIELNLEGIPSGMYFIEIRTDFKSRIEKLLIHQ